MVFYLKMQSDIQNFASYFERQRFWVIKRTFLVTKYHSKCSFCHLKCCSYQQKLHFEELLMTFVVKGHSHSISKPTV